MAALSTSSSPSSSPYDNNRLVCLVCQKQFSQYTCPRCRVRYCSLPCYRSHSARCLESFNRDNVLAEMRADPVASAETKKRMMQTLKRFYLDGGMDGEEGSFERLHRRGHGEEEEEEEEEVEDDDDDDDDGYDEGGADASRKTCVLSEETLNKLTSGEEVTLSDLSAEERKAFLQAIASGEFSHMIKPWEPWWYSPFVKKIALNKDGNRVVRFIDEMDDNAGKNFEIPPPLDIPLPQLSRLTCKPPSPLLGLHLIDILYSYCFTVRFYNGDYSYDALDAAKVCLTLSHVLGLASSPETVSEALSGCVETTCSPHFKSVGGYNFALTLLDDTIALLYSGRCGIICALSELHRMLERAAKNGKKAGGKNVSKIITQGKIKLLKDKASFAADLKKACKKVFFLLSWSNEQLDTTFSSLALLVEAEKARIAETRQSTVFEGSKKVLSCNSQREALVEEVV